MQWTKNRVNVNVNFWDEVLYLLIKEGNQEKRNTPKDHVIEVCNVIGMTSLHMNIDIHTFNFVYPVIEPMNSGTRNRHGCYFEVTETSKKCTKGKFKSVRLMTEKMNKMRLQFSPTVRKS